MNFQHFLPGSAAPRAYCDRAFVLPFFGAFIWLQHPTPPDYSHVRTSLQMLLPWLKGNIRPSFSPDFLPQPGQDSSILFLVPSLVLVGVISIALRRAGMVRYFHHIYFCSPCFPVVSSLRNAYFPNFYAIPFPPTEVLKNKSPTTKMRLWQPR